KSITSGTSGRSLAFCNAICRSRLISLCASQLDRVALTLPHDQPQRASTSPRSIARLISLPPGYPTTRRAFTSKMLRSILVNMSSSEPGPCPPTVNGIDNMSFQVLILEVFQDTHTDVSLLTLPIQV